MKVPFIIYADLESLLEKMNSCHNNPKKSSTTKINKHIPSGYSLLTHCSFDTTKNKLDYYKDKICLKNFYLDLKKHATKIINYEKKEVIPLTKDEKKIHREKNLCYLCKKGFSTYDDDNKKILRPFLKDYCHYTGKYRGTTRDICNLRYKIPKKFL